MTAQYLDRLNSMTDKGLLMVINRANRDMTKVVKGSRTFTFLQNEVGMARAVLRNRRAA